MLRRRLSDNARNAGSRAADCAERTGDRAAELDALLRAARPDSVALDPADSQRILTAALAAARPRSAAVVRTARALILLAPAGAALALALLAYPSGLALVAPQGRSVPGAPADRLALADLTTSAGGSRAGGQIGRPRLSRAPLAVTPGKHARRARRRIQVERAFYETTWPLPGRGLASLADARPAMPSIEPPAAPVAPVEANAPASKPKAGVQVAQLLVCVTGGDTRFDPAAPSLTVSVERGQEDAPGFAAASGYCAEPNGSLQWTRVCSSGAAPAPATSSCTIRTANDGDRAPAYLAVEVTTAPPAAEQGTSSLIPSNSTPIGTDATKGTDHDSDQTEDVVLLQDSETDLSVEA